MQSRAENVDRATLLERCADSVGDALARRVTRTPDKEAFRYPADRTSENPEWHSISWAETQELAHQAAAGFLALGLRPEQRVTICGTTRIEWIIADLGINCAAGATTTIYPNTAPEDMWYIIEDSDTVILVAEDEKQVAKLAGSELKLNHIIVFDNADQCDDERVISWSEFLKTGQAELAKNPECVTDAIALTAHDTLATLIYTSGTTGRPKGVELRHLSWVYEGVAMRSLHIIEDDSLQYLWLPLSHVFGKCLIAVQLEIGFASAVDGRIDR
ncbi:MAG: long-chain fatty acid--CoA ligase, partial [Propionibacterium sp.]